ncbi:MAG TPA: universal stress protein [Nocardioidaceae bacterium]|nr:universal stress protein [Nocardioidaceae bacterium]
MAYDGSSDADDALKWASEEAVRQGAPLRAVIIDDVSTSPWVHEWSGDHDDSMRAELIMKEEGVEAATTERHPGHVVPTLVHLAEKASILVAGSKGHGRLGEVFVGSVTQHLAAHAPCPVVVVRPAKKTDSGRIVVGIDGSPASGAALEFALARAEGTGEVVEAVYGWKMGRMPIDRKGEMPTSVGEKLDDKELLLAESVAGARAAHPDVVLIQTAIPVPPGQALVDASANASLVVVGSHGRGFFSGLLLGSVSHDVLHRAHCPVVIVR